MIVRAGDLLPEGRHLDLSPAIGPLGYAGGLEIAVTGARMAARVVPSRGGLQCSGRLEATAFVPCSRCLEPYPFQVAWDFDLKYILRPQGREEPGMELQIARDELDVAYLDEDGCLDTNALAAEQIYLSLPMKPLCSDTCRGLCPGCGVDLNNEACHCKPAA